MLHQIKRTVGRYLINLPGWHTTRKIVVIESDDWGSIRMPSREVYEKCLIEGYKIDTRIYERYDTLERSEDLNILFNTLSKHKDAKGNPPIITANSVTANPDFEKIKSADFQQYYYEPFTSTYLKYQGCGDSFQCIQEGMQNKIFYPQFHGREHFNTHRWLQHLQQNEKDTIFAFSHNMVGIPPKENPSIGNQMLIALNFKTEDERLSKKEILEDGLILFEKIFGYKSKSFIAPCYTWHPNIESLLKEHSVDYIQGSIFQSIPTVNGYVKKYHSLGEHNRFGQTYLTRNCSFEPTSNHNINHVQNCLQQIKRAFFMKKPAIISSHRINFMGAIDPVNREKNIKHLDSLLSQIISLWPDVEFMHSVNLGNLINKSK